MKSIRYAFADLLYYRKSTVLSIIVFSVFLLTANILLNLIDINKLGIDRLILFSPDQATITSYQSWNSFYLYGYIGVIFVYLAALIAASYFGVTSRQSTIKKWRLLGFSEIYIMMQVLLEIILLLFSSLILVSLLLIIFQNTYEAVLLKIHSLLEREDFRLGIHATITESVPSSSLDTNQTAEVISMGTQTLSFNKIGERLIQNSLILLLITVSCSIIFTNWGIYRNKNFFGK
ncbi:hypothetical protein IW492_14630 [Enterococcus sp. BWB1-3]|uniref:hypothetical protein n=1 Tax=Enterococcus sp. BWB1-3 TaxID=2787713 RepID=UPI0019247F6E|nr:hypothetical protein [Enterococcus sp. BWB1-3]MBL1230465.1 hypothetical protein [Enterococcus sp. BWB1-3]